MRSTTCLALTLILLVPSVGAQECACESTPIHHLAPGYAGPPQEQLYPFDRQDPWLHGQYQRVPSYGGYSSFRPHNYRHVAPQAHIAAQFGIASGMTYSHQFRNRDLQNMSYSGQSNQRPLMPVPHAANHPVLTPTQRSVRVSHAAEPRR